MVSYVFGAGSYFGLLSAPKKGDFIIAADGGYRYCLKEGLIPNLLCGDFDSLGEIPEFKNIVRVPVEKDDTDMELALRLGISNAADEFHIYGGTGGRPDHTLANYQTICRLSKKSIRCYLYGESYTASAITNGEIRFPAGKHGSVSVFCIGKKAEGVFEEGLKYSLEDAELFPDVPLGVSNSFTGKEARISVKKGTLLVMWEHGNEAVI